MKLSYQKEGRIAYLSLNRPEALNALDVAILSGEGKAVCAGFELRLETIDAYSSVGDFSQVRRRLARFFDKTAA